jgi:hypothetical protein
MSNHKQKKPTIECGFGENCARRNCTFKHPDSRNLDANLRKIQEERRKNRVALERQQMEMIGRECYHGDLCLQLSCPYRHSPAWNPAQNMRLAEEKRRQNELLREQQRQQALNVCYKEAIDNQNEVNERQQRKNSMSENSIDDDYQYDDEYFGVHEKVWKKQTKRQIGKW